MRLGAVEHSSRKVRCTKATASGDALQAARAAEVTSLWRLAAIA